MQIFSRRFCGSRVAVVLAGCQKTASDPFAESGKQADRIDCAVGGAAEFAPVCAIDRMEGPDGLVLTIRHPNGGFRRLKVTQDGRGVVPADGSEAATVGIAGDKRIEVAVGKDRYRLPATVKQRGA